LCIGASHDEVRDPARRDRTSSVGVTGCGAFRAERDDPARFESESIVFLP
jgi:hypothetical protein